jgi:hypothetical protein
MVFSSVLWYNEYRYSPGGFILRAWDGTDKEGISGGSMSTSFGFPGHILHIEYDATTNEYGYISIRRTATWISLFDFALDFLFYFAVLALPVLIVGVYITGRKKE